MVFFGFVFVSSLFMYVYLGKMSNAKRNYYLFTSDLSQLVTTKSLVTFWVKQLLLVIFKADR